MAGKNDDELRRRQEQVELMKLKQGIIEESAILKEEHVQVEKQGFVGRIENFFYRNGPLTIIFGLLAAVIIFMIIDLAFKPKADFKVLIAVSDYSMYDKTENMQSALSQYVGDLNGDGKVLIEVTNLLFADEDNVQSGEANRVKLMAELSMGETMLMICDQGVTTMMEADKGGIFDDLTKLFPDNAQVKTLGYYLKDSNFAKEAKLDTIKEGTYMGLRIDHAVEDGASEAEVAKTNYGIAKQVITRIINGEHIAPAQTTK